MPPGVPSALLGCTSCRAFQAEGELWSAPLLALSCRLLDQTPHCLFSYMASSAGAKRCSAGAIWAPRVPPAAPTALRSQGSRAEASSGEVRCGRKGRALSLAFWPSSASQPREPAACSAWGAPAREGPGAAARDARTERRAAGGAPAGAGPSRRGGRRGAEAPACGGAAVARSPAGSGGRGPHAPAAPDADLLSAAGLLVPLRR